MLISCFLHFKEGILSQAIKSISTAKDYFSLDSFVSPDLCLPAFWLPLTLPLLILPLLRDGPRWARLNLAGCAQLLKEVLWHRPRWPVCVCTASVHLVYIACFGRVMASLCMKRNEIT